MNRSTFTQSGELVTISRLKIKEKWKFLRSLRFRITVILVIIGIVPCVILEKSIVNSYEDRAVSVRSITVKISAILSATSSSSRITWKILDLMSSTDSSVC